MPPPTKGRIHPLHDGRRRGDVFINPNLSRSRASTRQTETRTGRQRHGQTERQRHGQTERQRDRQRERRTDRDTDRQRDRETGRERDRETGRETDRETDRQTDRDTERQTDRDTDGQTDRQRDRQTDRQLLQAAIIQSFGRSVGAPSFTSPLLLCGSRKGRSSRLLYRRRWRRRTHFAEPDDIHVCGGMSVALEGGGCRRGGRRTSVRPSVGMTR